MANQLPLLRNWSRKLPNYLFRN